MKEKEFKLKDLFIKRKEEEEDVVLVQQTNSNEVASIPPTVLSQTMSTPSMATTEVSQDVMSMIYELLIKRNLPGPDYLEFKSAVGALKNMPVADDVRFQGAFSVVLSSNPGFTKNILVQSVDTYVGIVREELSNGLKEYEEKRQAEVGNKQQSVLDLKQQVQDLDKQISDLTAKRNQLMGSINTIEAEIATASASLDKQKQVFINSVNQVIENLEKDKQQISKTIQ